MAPATPRAISHDAIDAKWLILGGEKGWLGKPTTQGSCGLADGGCYQHFEGGSIYWTPAHGSYFVRGRIRDHWAHLGWEHGRLGFPVSDEFCGLRGGGCGQRFTGGLIYWAPGLGAHAVWGAIQHAYTSVQWEKSPLGLPTSGEFCNLADGGCAQRFTGGMILWQRSHGAHPIWGAMHDKYAEHRFENGPLGYPTSAQFCNLTNGGCAQRFTGGNIYRSRAGTHAVHGRIWRAYEASRWERGPLGYPTSDEFCDLVQSGCGTRFENGLILWSPGTGAHPIRGAILRQYADMGYERSSLGYPKGSERTVDGIAIQTFQNGDLTYRFNTGQVAQPNGGYPDADAVPCGTNWCKFGYRYSARGFAYRNCTDFVAWKKGMVWSQISGNNDGNALNWRAGWLERGRTVSSVPKVGSIAWWGASRGGGYGHVGMVVGVNPNGSVDVEHYNFDIRGGHSITRNLRAEAYLY